MSSSDRRTVAKAARRPAKATKLPRKPASASKVKAAKPVIDKPVAATGSSPSLSSDAIALASQVEQALKDGRLDVLTPEALQLLFAGLCKLYSANVEQGAPYLPVNSRSGVTPTDVMVVASKLLRATNLQVFELGMWQSWTGR